MNNNPNNENLNQQQSASPVETTTGANNQVQGLQGISQPQGASQVVQPTGPVPPQQDRVSLINNKPAIQTMIPNQDVSVKTVSKPTEGVSDDTEILDVVEEPLSDAGGNGIPSGSDTPTKGGKLRTFLLFVLFGGLFALVIFLPEISSFIENQKYLKNQANEKITTGTLKCSYENSSDKFDYTYSLDFEFAESRLNKLIYELEIRGDANLDEADLELQKAECDQLVLNAEELSGITVSCSLENGLFTQRQVLNYAGIDEDAALAAYTEAGGIYPDYQSGQSIDEIEKNMNASGYTCERIK